MQDKCIFLSFSHLLHSLGRVNATCRNEKNKKDTCWIWHERGEIEGRGEKSFKSISPPSFFHFAILSRAFALSPLLSSEFKALLPFCHYLHKLQLFLSQALQTSDREEKRKIEIPKDSIMVYSGHSSRGR